MDYITLIAGIFTIAAAVATIFGVSFAIGTYGDWRKSHKYTKIIDIDTTINSIKREVDFGLRSFWLYQGSVINGSANQAHFDEYDMSSKKLDELISIYQTQGNELSRMGQKDLSKVMISPVNLAVLVFGAHKNTMERMVNIDMLNEYYWSKVVDRNEILFAKMNKYLDGLKEI